MSDSGDLLLGKLETLKGQFSEWHSILEANRRFYRLEIENDVLPSHADDWDIMPIIPPTARRAIDEAVDHVLTRVDVKVPVRETDKAKHEQQMTAELKRQWLKLWWDNVDARFNLMGDIRKPIFSEGRVCVRHTINWKVIPDLPDEAAGKTDTRAFREAIAELGMRDDFLWDEQILDNITVFEDPSNHRDPQYVFVEYEVLTEEARRLFPRKNDKSAEEGRENAAGELTDKEAWRDGDDYAKIHYREYWSKGNEQESGKFCQWIEEEIVNATTNPYPYVPIAIEDSGYGENRVNSTIEEKYVGLTQYMHSVFIAEARQMTSWEAVSELGAFPVAMTRNWPDDKDMEFGPGSRISLRGQKGEIGAEELDFMALPEIPLGVVRLADKTNSMANSALKMDTLGGVPLSGVETATEADQQIRNATSKLHGPLSALKRLAAKLSSWTLMDIELVLEAPVTLCGSADNVNGEQRLAPKDIDGFYMVKAELTTTDEDAINMVKARFWAELYQLLPFLPAVVAMERGNVVDNPNEAMLQRDAEEIFRSEEMATARKLAAAKSVGEFQMAVAELVRKMQGPGGGQQGGGEEGGGPADVTAATRMLGQNIPGSPTEQLVAQAQGQRDVQQRPAQVRGPYGAGT